MRPRRARAGLPPTLALLLLSALWAFASLRADLVPHLGANPVPPALGNTLLFAIFAAIAGFMCKVRRLPFPRGRDAFACAGLGLGLFAVPAGLTALAQPWISNLDQVAVFALTPVFAVVLEPHLQGDTPPPGKAALFGALAAVAGVLFLFPLDMPGSFRAGLALGALVAAACLIAAANCVAVRLAREFAKPSILPMATQVSAASALCFASAAFFAPHPAFRWSALPAPLLLLLLTDLPALFLLFWLLPRLAASRMTARFLLAPLIAILADLALAPTLPPLRALLGMALLAGGAGWIVFVPAERDETEERNALHALAADAQRRPPTDAPQRPPADAPRRPPTDA